MNKYAANRSRDRSVQLTDAAIGTRLGSHEVLGLIGEGGMRSESSLSVTPATSVFEEPLFGGVYAPAADGRRLLIGMPAPPTDVVPMERQLDPLVPRAGAE